MQRRAREVAAGVNATLVRPVGVIVLSRLSFEQASPGELRPMFAEALQGNMLSSV